MNRLLVLAVGLQLITSNATAETAQTVTLGQALASAKSTAPDLEASKHASRAAERRTKATKRTRLPSLRVDSAINLWNDELAFDVLDPMTGMAAAPIVVRERITSQTSVSINLPLSSQFALTHYIKRSRASQRAIRADGETTQLDVAFRTSELYFQLLEAQAAEKIVAAVVRQRTAQLERARVLQNGGVLERVDVMRLEAAVADARRSAIAARTRAEATSDALAVTIGMNKGLIRAVDNFPATPTAPSQRLTSASRGAAGHRPELLALRARARAAEENAQVERAPLYPNISAVGTFQYNTGQGAFAPRTALFAGLVLEWNVWDWGRQWNLAKAADAEAQLVRVRERQAQDSISLESRRRLREASATFESLAVSVVGKKAAEEAFRIQTIRFKEGATTTTDLLDAETEVTKARLGFTQARYSYFLSLARLARAAGLAPMELLP